MHIPKKTLIIGASIKPTRYAYLAAHRLSQHQHPIVLIGREEGELFGEIIHTQKIELENIHTVSLYIAPRWQAEYYDYLIKMRPKRIIFNPGTENLELKKLAEENGIIGEYACTLVLLSTGGY